MNKSVILDTNLLILFVVGGVSKSYISSHKALNRYNVEHYELLLRLLEKLGPPVIVTPNTLTEASNLLKRIADPAKTEIYRYLQATIEKIQEQYIESIYASKRGEFTRLGITDSVLLELGKDNAVILTTDHALHIAACTSGYAAINFWHVVEGGLESIVKSV